MDLARIEGAIDRTAAGSTAISMGFGGVQFQTMIEVMEFAKLMAVSGAAVPKHLRGNAGACLAICTRALRFGLDPFAIAEHSYLVDNRGQELVAYDSFVVHAIIEARAPLNGRLRFEIIGEGDDRRCKVTGTPKGEKAALEFISEPLGKLRPGRNQNGNIKGSPLWDTKPEQQLIYNARRDFCRIYFPDVLLGVYDRDEFDEHRGPDKAKDVTPDKPAIADRLKNKGKRGFDAEHVERETAPVAVQSINEFQGADPEEVKNAIAAVSERKNAELAADVLSTITEAHDAAAGLVSPIGEAESSTAADASPPSTPVAAGEAGAGADVVATDEGSAPTNLFATYASTLYEAKDAVAFRALVTEFWKTHEWPEDGTPERARVERIWKLHTLRLKGEIEPKAMAEEIRELVTA